MTDYLVVSINTDYNDKWLIFVALPPFPHIIRPAVFICLLPLTSSSRRPPYLTYQRNSVFGYAPELGVSSNLLYQKLFLLSPPRPG